MAGRCTEKRKQQKSCIFFFFLPCLCRSSGWSPGRAAPSAAPGLSPGTRPAGWGGPHTRPPTTEAKAKREWCLGRPGPCDLSLPWTQIAQEALNSGQCSSHDSGDRWSGSHQTFRPGIEDRTSVQRPQDEKTHEEGKAGRDPHRREAQQVLKLSACRWNLGTFQMNEALGDLWLPQVGLPRVLAQLLCC